MGKRTIEKIVKKVADKAGISKTVSPHVLRDVFPVNKKIKKIDTYTSSIIR
jgi:integrase/recombinase XerD